MSTSTATPIVPRQGPDLGLSGDIPRFWFGGDPFKTRFFDANSLLTPVGERYFIQCVRDYREQVGDAAQAEDLRNFVYQEGQHSIVHNRFNKLLQDQGIDTVAIEGRAQRWFDRYRRWLSPRLNLALTAAYEHFTTINALAYAPGIALMQTAEPRVLAMFLWHGVEEVEHRAVAYELARGLAGVGLRWMYGPGGFYTPLLREYLAWYRPGYHPGTIPMPERHRRWIETYARDGDALAAAEAFRAA